MFGSLITIFLWRNKFHFTRGWNSTKDLILTGGQSILAIIAKAPKKGASFDRIRTFASGKVLKGHIFKSKRVQDPHECLMFCYSEFTCQSYNYVIIGKLCELNNRTKEARPGDFVQDETRFYVRRWRNRGTEAKKKSSLNLSSHKGLVKINTCHSCKHQFPFSFWTIATSWYRKVKIFSNFINF